MGNFESSYEEYEDVPVNKPPVRNWEITENSTRYERLVAAPSDEDRILMWWMWGIVASVAVIPVLTVFVGILSSARARKSAFNQYLLFLVTPDITYTSICIVNCFLNIAEGEFYSEFMCYFQSWYVMFGISGSAYMNALLAREIYHMLSYGQNFRHYETPTTAKIARDSIAVLLFSAFVSSWGIYNGVWHVTWLPYKTVLMNGLGCFPQDFDLPTGLFYYLFAYPALLAAPMGYVFFLCFRIWYKKMLPKQGRRRMLATFFLRLVAIYVIMWTPALLLVSTFNHFNTPWAKWSGAAWAHSQGPVSALFILSKPDVRQAVKELLTCRCQWRRGDHLTSISTLHASRRQRRRSSAANQLQRAHGPGSNRSFHPVHSNRPFTKNGSIRNMRFDEQAVSEDIAPFSSPEEMTSAAQQPSVAWPSEESLRHALPFQNATISGIEEEEDGDDNSERLGGGFSSVLLDDDDEENDDANDYDENGNHALPVSAPGEGEGTEEDPSEGVWP